MRLRGELTEDTKREKDPRHAIVQWQVIDINLDASTVRLEKREAGQQQWSDVTRRAATVTLPTAIQPKVEGNVAFAIQGSAVEVRLTASDKAGNVGTTILRLPASER
jgi:hypothetical protein